MTDDDARRDLAFIRQVIDEGRGYAAMGGGHLVIWGGLVGLAALAEYAGYAGVLPSKPGLVWGSIYAIGWIASIALGVIDDQRAKVKSFATRLMPMLWLAAGISLTSLYLGARLLEAPIAVVMPAPAAVTMGLVFFVSSFLCGHTWLRWIALGWWLAGPLLLSLRQDSSILLVVAALNLGLLALPGLVLLRRPMPAAATA
ncbi:MAG: hypothetical protein HYR63_07895 [Proteobacteria bacterium]|nr:hypothetical protein [Pseudomonadota bacterium]MBI3497783.1 hypothetical protein [Pseudomonadota bacterium]